LNASEPLLRCRK